MELKFGHRVIATRNFDAREYRGRYISDSDLLHCILVDGKSDPTWYNNVELDPEATEFLPGDEVEMTDNVLTPWYRMTYQRPHPNGRGHYDNMNTLWQHCRYPSKDSLNGKVAIIDGKEYELRLK